MEPSRHYHPKGEYTPQEQAKRNQTRTSPLVRGNKVVPGSLSAQVRARNDQRAEDQKANEVPKHIVTFTAALAFNEPLKIRKRTVKMERSLYARK